VLPGDQAFDLYATYGLHWKSRRDIAREQGYEVDEASFRQHGETPPGIRTRAKAFGPLGGEDADFYRDLLADLQAEGKIGRKVWFKPI